MACLYPGTCILCSNVYYYVLLRDTPLLRVINNYKCKSHTVNIAACIYSLLPMTYSSMSSIPHIISAFYQVKVILQ